MDKWAHSEAQLFYDGLVFELTGSDRVIMTGIGGCGTLPPKPLQPRKPNPKPLEAEKPKPETLLGCRA